MKIIKELFNVKENSGVKSFTKDKILLIAIAGIILVISSYMEVKKADDIEIEKKESEEILEENYALDLEKRLENIIKSIKGTGECKVMITLKSTGEKILQKDVVSSSKQETSDNSNLKTVDLSENTLVLSGDEEIPYITKEIMPSIEGVVVVTEGADDPVLCQTIIQLVQALFDVHMHKISIVEMK